MDKKHIIEEIKRVAAILETTPGVAQFKQESGITSFEIERYWPRWGDALREAGFAPNQMQDAYSDETLFEMLCPVIRELGRFPTYREITMRSRAGKGLPNGKTFQRLGTKREFAAKLKAYSEAREGYEDIAVSCDLVLGRTEGEVHERAERGEDFGFVYLAKSGRYYKIGRSNSAGRREYEVALQMPEKYVTVHTIRTDDPSGIEAYWHKRFADRRKNGEWFDLSPRDVTTFKRRKFM